jgi:Tol biopolymer transport system component
MSGSVRFVLIGFAILCLLIPVTAWDYTTLASMATDGTRANRDSWFPAISDNGRYVAFQTDCGVLVTGDTNGLMDIFLHSRVTGTTTRVSVASDGTQGNGDSNLPSVSEIGRFVAFSSLATNLVKGDTNDVMDVFVHDGMTGETTRISVATGGAQGDGNSDVPSISDDGRYVAFQSEAANLVRDDTNDVVDIFVRDRVSEETTRVSVASGGSQGNGPSLVPSISGNSRFVAFYSIANNLVTGDGNVMMDVFVHDRISGNTSRISVATAGTQGNNHSQNPSISRDGRYVAFQSDASNLVTSDTNTAPDIFVHDQTTGETTRISVASSGAQGSSSSNRPSISGDGQYVAFQSDATNLVSGDTNSATDIFVRNRTSSQTTRASVVSGGIQSNGTSGNPAISRDGRFLAFESGASNLVTGDTNRDDDIFTHTSAIRHNAVFRPSAYNNWIFTRDLILAESRDHYGMATDIPLVADFNNDGVMDRAVFRAGSWIVDYSMDGSVNSNTLYGLGTDIPLAGYFNDDGYTDRAVFRNGEWIFDYGMDGDVDDRNDYGMTGDIPLAGDINYDGNADRAVFRNGSWIVDLGMDGTVDSRTPYGLSTDNPLFGLFDDNTVMDKAVFRNGQWIVDLNMDGSVNWRMNFGAAGDRPLIWLEE